MINCANGGFTHLPRGLKGDGRYPTLIMIHNQINTLTEKDMDALHGFKEVDMRDNPLNCTLLNALDYKMIILSDCISSFLVRNLRLQSLTTVQQNTIRVA